MSESKSDFDLLVDELISSFDEKLRSLGVSDMYREKLVANVVNKKSLSAKVSTVTTILNEIEDKQSRAALSSHFKGIAPNEW